MLLVVLFKKKTFIYALIMLLLHSHIAPMAFAAGPRIGVASLWTPSFSASDKLELLDSIVDRIRSSSRLSVVTDKNIKEYLKEEQQSSIGKKAGLDEAKAALEDGKESYLTLKLKEAKKHLEQAKKLFILNLNQLESNQLLLESYLFLGMTYAVSGDSGSAIKEFQNVTLLDPNMDLQPKDYSPEIINTFTKAKQEVSQREKANMLFESNPPRAVLYINGKKSGETPQNINLPVGEYFFRLSKPGHQDWYKVLRVDEGFKRRKQTLEPLGIADETSLLYRTVNRQSPATATLTNELTQQAIRIQTDMILLGEIHKGKKWSLRLQLFDARTQEFSRVESIQSSGEAKDMQQRLPILVRNLLGQIAPTGYIIPDRALSPKLMPPAPKPIPEKLTSLDELSEQQRVKELLAKGKKAKKTKPWQEWWFWVIIGAVAAGGTTAGVLATQSGSDTIVIDNSGNLP